jgi:putative heme-binding domain-containing protein
MSSNRVRCWWRASLLGLLAVVLGTTVSVAQKAGPPSKEVKGEAKKAPRPIVRKWKVSDFEPFLEEGLVNRNFDRGKRIYKEATCALCHTFGDEGGTVGPVLTEAAGRFSAVDFLLHIIEPSKVIPDAYTNMVVELDDGKVLVGLVEEFEDSIQIVTDVLYPDRKVAVDRERIVSLDKSPVSPMPANLIDAFRADEVLDLLAFLLSRGDRNSELFQPSN